MTTWDLTISDGPFGLLWTKSASAGSWPELLGLWLPFGVDSLEPVPGGSLTIRNPDGIPWKR